MKKNQFAVGTLIVLASLLLFACSSTEAKQAENKYLSDLDKGRINEAMDYLESLDDKNNAIRNEMDLALLEHYAGLYESSEKRSAELDVLMDAAATKSISKEVGAAALNENIAEYVQNPYEYIYINIFNALNYYNQGLVDDALVEIRKLNIKQRQFLVKYAEEVTSSEYLEEEGGADVKEAYRTLHLDTRRLGEGSPSKPTEDDIFMDSPAARFLSMVFYMMEGDKDNAAIDARSLRKLNGSFDTASELEIPSGMGRLDVLSFADLIGRRGEQRIILGPIPDIVIPVNRSLVVIPAFDLEYTYPAFPAPELKFRPMTYYGPHTVGEYTLNPGHMDLTKNSVQKVDHVRFFIDDSEGTELELLEDFNYAVQKDVNTKAYKSWSRSLARSTTKKLTAITTGAVTLYSAEKALQEASRGDAISGLAAQGVYMLSYMGVVQAIDAVDQTEEADIRQVYTLPAKAFEKGVNLPPGTYSVKVCYYSKDDRLLKTESFKDVKVEEGKPVLVESTFVME